MFMSNVLRTRTFDFCSGIFNQSHRVEIQRNKHNNFNRSNKMSFWVRDASRKPAS